MAVLLTRPLEDSRRLAATLEAEGVEALIWPLTRIVPLVFELRLPPGIDGVLATSAHGIRAFAGLTGRRDLPVLAVGRRTADVARGLGFGLVISADGDAEALASLVRQSGLRHLLHPRGRDAAGDLKAALAPGGQRVSEAVLYAAEPAGAPTADVAHALVSGRVALLTAWSPRNARLLAEALPGTNAPLSAMRAVAISAAAAAPLQPLGFASVDVAPAPDGRAMLGAILSAAGTGA